MNVATGLAARVGQIIAMANPLSYANENLANASILSDEYEVESYSTQTTTTIDSDNEGAPSSPFVANIPDPSNFENEENISPGRHVARMTSKSPIDREATSPLKMLKSRASPTKAQSSQMESEPTRSPRKLSSAEKRFPIRVSVSPEKRPALEERSLTIRDVLRDNEGLTKAIEILEDEDSEINTGENVSEDTLTSLPGADDNAPNADDTMVSTFSTFSAGEYCSLLRNRDSLAQLLTF